MLVVRFGVWTVSFIPIQFLRCCFPGAVGTFVSLGSQTDVNTVALNGQMSQLNPFAMAMKLGDFSPTDSAYGAFERAFDRDDVIAALVRSHFQNRHIGYVQRK